MNRPVAPTVGLQKSKERITRSGKHLNISMLVLFSTLFFQVYGQEIVRLDKSAELYLASKRTAGHESLIRAHQGGLRATK